MTSTRIRRAALAASVLSLLPGSVRAQTSVRKPASAVSPKVQSWQIKGRVLTVRGIAAPAAEVEIRVEGERRPPRTVETDGGGEFQVSLPARGGLSSGTQVALHARKDGYLDARDVIELGSAHPLRAAKLVVEPVVELVLQKETADAHLLAWDDLIPALRPRLQTRAAVAHLAAGELEQYNLAVRLLDQDRPEDAAPIFAELGRHHSASIECRTLAGLAELASGAWGSASSELYQAARLAASAPVKASTAAPFTALGTLETWRGEFPKAEVSFLQALEITPDDPLVLEELGRAFVLGGQMTTGDHYVEMALAHGAGANAHLIRAQALLDLNQPAKAHKQLDAFLGGRKPKQLPLGPRSLWTDLAERLKLESAGGAATVVDRSPKELADAAPELKGLTPAADQSALESILQKTGESVQALFRDFPDTSSKEEINMERLHPGGKVADFLAQSFEYLLVNATDENGVRVNEYRRDKAGSSANPGQDGRDFMVTKGFASTPLIFYPDWQDGSDFRLAGRQRLDGRDILVIAFAERPARAKMLEEFKLKDRSAVVLVQGLAWVDAATYKILRMRTDLLKPAPEVRLNAQTTDVRYGEVDFKAKGRSLWLPREVSVTVSSNGRIYHNLHRYSDYQLFQVRTQQHLKAPKTRAAPDER